VHGFESKINYFFITSFLIITLRSWQQWGRYDNEFVNISCFSVTMVTKRQWDRDDIVEYSESINYDIRSFGQSILVSSPIWGSCPDIKYYLTVTVFFSMSGAPSDMRSGLSFYSVTWTASVQFSKFASGPRQHSIYLSVFITPGERVA
jgi:hypothetical protein